MNPGQNQFLNFILERVHEEQKDAANELLKGNFEKQEKGTFTREDMAETQAALIKMLKPEAVGEVEAAMAHFALNTNLKSQ